MTPDDGLPIHWSPRARWLYGISRQRRLWDRHGRLVKAVYDPQDIRIPPDPPPEKEEWRTEHEARLKREYQKRWRKKKEERRAWQRQYWRDNSARYREKRRKKGGGAS